MRVIALRKSTEIQARLPKYALVKVCKQRTAVKEMIEISRQNISFQVQFKGTF
jgi:hypothetical protein